MCVTKGVCFKPAVYWVTDVAISGPSPMWGVSVSPNISSWHTDGLHTLQ